MPPHIKKTKSGIKLYLVRTRDATPVEIAVDDLIAEIEAKPERDWDKIALGKYVGHEPLNDEDWILVLEDYLEDIQKAVERLKVQQCLQGIHTAIRY